MVNSEVERPEVTYASLCIYGDNLQPSAITARLKCCPTSSAMRGDLIRKNVFSSRGVWILSSQEFLQSDDPSDHILWLSDSSGIDIEELDIIQKEGFEIRVYVYWLLTCGNGGPVIGLKALRNLVKLGAELDIDVYFDPTE